jgi:hypothetical protein
MAPELYDSRIGARGNTARVGGKPFDFSGNSHPCCTNTVMPAGRAAVSVDAINRPHVRMLTYTCNLLNYLQCNSISKVNLILEQTISRSMLYIASMLLM